MPYPKLSDCQSFNKLLHLKHQSFSLKEMLDPHRILSHTITNSPLTFSYAASFVTDKSITFFDELIQEQSLIERYKNLLSGDPVNTSENRAVSHHKTRSKDRAHYCAIQDTINQFASAIRSKSILSPSGKGYTQLILIGIGGSYLGPQALYTALKQYVAQQTNVIPIHIISNIDPDNALSTLSEIDYHTTLFCLISKSGTTQETLTNYTLIKEAAKKHHLDINKQTITITGKNSPLDKPKTFLRVFHIDDAIGGRFSSTSAVGGCPLSISFGPDIFNDILKGAYQLDQSALNPNPRENASLMAALIGVVERNLLNYPAKIICPYSHALKPFITHLQQLDCESNGKQTCLDNTPCPYQTGPLILGEPGSNAQHSFFQKLHQGTDNYPIQFIGFQNPQSDKTHYHKQHKILNANMIAQIIAFSNGENHTTVSEAFPGNRPSSCLIAEQLTPHTMGALLAFYENLVMFQGFIWNINSFDQPGVELGKKLTKQLLDGKDPSPLLNAYDQLLNTPIS